MKFKTFMKIVFAGMILLIGGTCYGCFNLLNGKSSPRQTDRPTELPTAVSATSAPAEDVPTTSDATPVADSGPGAMRPFDQRIVDRAGTDIGGDKIKDAIPGQVKVNLYADGGQGVNRAKLDLDRDDKFDEKWTFERAGGTWKVKRQVAPNDDEKYTLEYRLQEGRWVQK